MERTPRLLRIILVSLPPAPDATITIPEVEAGGAVDDEQHSAEFLAAAANDSSPTERGLEAGGAVDDHEQYGRIHHVEAGAGRKGMHTISEHQELSVPAASDHAAPKNNLTAAAVEKNGCTDRGLLHHRIPGEGRQDTIVAEHPDLNAPAASERAGNITAFDAEEVSSCYTRYDQYSDLYLHGRPVSNFWETLWLGSPLVFHDRHLLSIRRYIAGCQKTAFSADLTREINLILDSHPGPIASFRLDSCSWTGGSETLGMWLETLSSHRVHELTVVNRRLPTTTVFPINKLQGPDLTMLSLAFFDVPNLSFGAFDYRSLDTLQLIGCTYCSKGLESVVLDCPGLRSLVLGCSHGDICITSQSLISIQIWNCTASFLRIDYAPKLLILATGVRPKEGQQCVLLSMDNVQALEDIRYLMLPFHDITVRSATVIEGVIALPQVRRVGIGMQMGNAGQRRGLISTLKLMPRLTHLILQIVEDSLTDQEYDDVSTSSIGSISCVQMSLQSLKVEGFQGGRPLDAVIAGILSKAGKLVEVVLEPPLSAVAAANEAARKFAQCPRASIGCRFIVQNPD